MDGLEASEKILAFDIDVPIVAMTANIMCDDKKYYMKHGMRDCVGKPFTSQELWQCLLKYFEPVTVQKEDSARLEQADNELRQKLINNFVKNNCAKFSEISEAISTGDIKLAHRLAHTLKSNAGQLKKTALQKAAEEVERQLSDTRYVEPSVMKVFESELNAVLTELKPLVRELSPSLEGKQPLELAAARELLEKLEPLLEDFNIECLTLADSVRMIPGSEDLTLHMQNLDFVTALKALAELKKNLK
jgi:CheY-like chemotaxis protein